MATATLNPTAADATQTAGALTPVAPGAPDAAAPEVKTSVSLLGIKESTARLLAQPSVRKFLPFISIGVVLLFFVLT